mgnify:CR=1 FL=1
MVCGCLTNSLTAVHCWVTLGNNPANLGQGDEKGFDVGGEVAGRSQVVVDLPALPKFLQAVVKLGRHNDLG